MATERINIVVSSKGTVTVKKELREIGQEARRSADGVDLLEGALTAWLTGNALGMLTRYADAFTNIQNRLKLVTNGSDELTAAQERLYKIAQSTYQGFENTVQVFQRTATATQQLGYSTEEALAFTEQLSQAVALSGVSAESASAALVQLSQGLASGTLRGQELNSMLEQLPYASQALATGLGVTVGQLRALAEQGQLTPKQIIDAFAKMKDAIANDMAAMTPTISQGLQTIENGFIRLLGIMEKNTGVFSLVGTALTMLGNNMEIVALAVTPLVAALTLLAGRVLGGLLVSATASAISSLTAMATTATRLAVVMGTTLVSAIMSAVSAFAALTAAILTNPIALIIAGITAAVVGLGYAILSLTGYLDEVWAYLQEWAQWVLDKFTGLREAIEAVFGSVFEGGEISFNTDGLKKAMEGVNKGTTEALEKGGETVKQKITEGMASGGGQAASQMGATFDRAADKQTNINDVFVSKFEGTGRNIYDLWNNWGDAFVDSFGTTIGELLIDYQQAMTKNLEAQAELFKAQAKEIRHNIANDKANGGGSSMGRGSRGGNSPYGRNASSLDGFGKHNRLDAYATGGQFMVGGQGGTDSQKVEFMASPNERVTVETPAQQRAADRGAYPQSSPAPAPVIINQFDPRSQVDAMASHAGREATYNTIAADPERTRRILGL